MKITATFLTFLDLFLPHAHPQAYTEPTLPKDAIARLGEGAINEIRDSPDGFRLAVVGSSRIWLYDTKIYQKVALLTGHTGLVSGIAFSLVNGSSDGTVRLWHVPTGEFDILPGLKDGYSCVLQ